MMNLRTRLILSAFAATALLTSVWSTHDVRSAQPPAAQSYAPGLTLTFQSKDGKTDARVARLVSLLVPAKTPATPFLEPGPFKATFEGFIDQKLRGDFRFSATGTGKVKVSIADKPIFEASGDLGGAEEKSATLKKGKNKIVVEYESPDDGDAVLKLAWSSDDFPAEPIDPKLLTYAPGAKDVTTGQQVREGRALFADLHCIRCHTDASATGMPELAKDAPNLEKVGERLNEKWMARWIANPKSLRPDTSMPKVFHGTAGQTPQDAADVAAYLATCGDRSTAKPPKDEDAVAGGRLVAKLGCIGCHTLPQNYNPNDPHGRISWSYVAEKYQPAALTAFLKKPEEHYAWIRMPNFRLSDDEARQITAYLLLTGGKAIEGEAPKGDPAKGKDLFHSAGCVSCHQINGTGARSAPALTTAEKGCMATDASARGKAPDFGQTESQHAALAAFLATDRSSLKRDVPSEFAQRQIVELRCTACHSRDTKIDLWDDLIKEVESLAKGDTVDPESNGANPGAAGKGPLAGEAQPGTGDQGRPPLTWTGEKLKPEWMATFIAGKLDYKPRAWMLARMPGFPARAEGLAVGLAMEHACPAKSPEEKAPDEALAATGKQLVSRNGGFSCVQCHGIGNIAPISPFEAPSINFKYTNERLRKEYYDRWMKDPTRIVPTTKMPKFQNDGKTALNDILEGDADKQFDAIWNYLQAGRKIQHPEQQ